MIKHPYRVPSMAEINALPKNGYKVISTFSGCGGSSLGYKMAGFTVVWANEFVPAARDTYSANHPTTILDGRDIREVKPEEILAATGLAKGELDLFDGSPPCASFSMAGKREEHWGKVKKYSDVKQRTDDLFFEFARLLAGLQPKAFVAENVAGLTVGTAKKMLGEGQLDAFESQDDTIVHTLMDCGYRVGLRILNAADLGVPQSRRRAIFVGVRKDLAGMGEIEPAWPGKLPWVYTVRDAVPWITGITGRTGPQFARVESEIDHPMNTIQASDPDQTRYEVEAASDISKYAIGREWDNLKPGEQSDKYFSLVKVDPDAPCPTVCASHGAQSIASITHPTEKRKFSIGELKRICAFPDDFVLLGTYPQQWERLGRAVPPVMMAAVAATVRDEILAKMGLPTPPKASPEAVEEAPKAEPAPIEVSVASEAPKAEEDAPATVVEAPEAQLELF